MQHIHPFEAVLSVQTVDIEGVLSLETPIDWLDFWLNPRRLRGSDFLMRWSQGVWSEQRLSEAVNATGDWFALPYGPSGVAPSNDVRAYELYFERLENAGLGRIKRPDLLIFPARQKKFVHDVLQSLGGQTELPFTLEEDERVDKLLKAGQPALHSPSSSFFGVEGTPTVDLIR